MNVSRMSIQRTGGLRQLNHHGSACNNAISRQNPTFYFGIDSIGFANQHFALFEKFGINLNPYKVHALFFEQSGVWNRNGLLIGNGFQIYFDKTAWDETSGIINLNRNRERIQIYGFMAKNWMRAMCPELRA